VSKSSCAEWRRQLPPQCLRQLRACPMRGNITRRGKSSWRLKYDVGTDSDRQIAYVTVRGTGKQAEAELAKRLNELAEGRYVAPTVETVESYARHWLANIAPAERSPLTLERYTSIIRAHIIPRLGPIPLQALDGKAIDGFYAHCRKQGRRDGAGLASGTLQNVHRLLSQVLRSAVKAKKLARSPIDDVETQPKPKRKKIEVLDESEIATFACSPQGPLALHADGACRLHGNEARRGSWPKVARHRFR